MFKTILASAVIAASALSGTAANAGVGSIVSAVGATVDTNGPGNGSIADTRNQNGLSINYLSGVTNFDAYMALNPLHTPTFAGFEFFGNSGTSTLQVTYDLGQVRKISALALWNEETSGIGRLNLLKSIDGVTFTAFKNNLAPTDNPLASYGANVFGFDAVSTRYVRFAASGCPQPNPGTFNSCAIGEVAFKNVVPEPASWAMLIAGFGLVGAAMRRRAAASAIVTA